MTPQEQTMIGELVNRINQTQLAEKDPDAEQMLQQGLGRNPDALYILAQTVLVQKYALEQAQGQLAQAKDQLEQMRQQQATPQPQRTGSFLGNLLHLNDAPGSPPPPRPYAPVPGTQYGAPPVQYGPPVPQYGQPMGYGAPQGGAFLQGAMQTAAGVAAGALAFEGIESLMHGFGHAAGYGGQGLGGFGGGDRPEVINNYYGDEHGEGRSEHGEHGVSAAESEEGQREDRFDHEDKGSKGSDFADTSSDDSRGPDDDVSDSSVDDGGDNFSDGGGGDDSSFS